MILRRIIEHLRKQEWTAIGIDFVIVVIGVFVGIQLGNWNEARAMRAQESAYLAQLRDEIVENDRMLEYLAIYTDRSVEAGRTALEWLESDEPCGSRCGELLIDFFHASQLWGTGFQTGKYAENERRSFPTDGATRAAVRRFYIYLAGWDPINLTPPVYRERLRRRLSPEAAAVLWGDCFIVEAEIETMSTDCAPQLADVDTASVLRAIRADDQIADDLRFWIGQNIFAQQEYPRARESAASAIAAINAEIGPP
ncbi:MAG: hypothetical protein R3C27_11735 [Hyphomonadaceae bacterium]